MTGCRKIGPLLEPYADGRLEPRKTAEVSRHVASCAACARRLASVRRLVGALESGAVITAPPGFRANVMKEVYRLAMAGYPSRTDAEEKESQRGRFYRRLGLCFMLSAAILAVSLVIPRLSYPTIFTSKTVAADLSVNGASVVRVTLAGADRVVRGALSAQQPPREEQNGGNPR
jgi:anti-sigma factor RsiW